MVRYGSKLPYVARGGANKHCADTFRANVLNITDDIVTLNLAKRVNLVYQYLYIKEL
jgi:hypothetical protein